MQLKRHFRAGRRPREAVMTFLEGNPIGCGLGVGSTPTHMPGGGWERKTESITARPLCPFRARRANLRQQSRLGVSKVGSLELLVTQRVL